MKGRYNLALGLATVATLLCAASVQAILIENVTQGTVLFDSGGFEGETAGADPVSPLVGTYLIDAAAGRLPLGTVIDANDPAVIPFDLDQPPTAYEGSKFVGEDAFIHMTRETIFHDPQGVATRIVENDQLRMSWAQYLPSTHTGEFRLRLTGGTAENNEVSIIDFQPVGDGGEVRGWNPYTDGYPSYTDSTLVIVQDQWQEVILEHTVGSEDLSITLDGVTELLPGVVGIAAEVPGDRYNPPELFRIRWNGSTAGNTYIDSIPSAPVLVLLGDANGDSLVTGADLISVQQNFGKTGTPPLPGDANNDGLVTGADLISVQQNFGNTLAPVGAEVPEPTSACLLTLAGLGAMACRRRVAA